MNQGEQGSEQCYSRLSASVHTSRFLRQTLCNLTHQIRKNFSYFSFILLFFSFNACWFSGNLSTSFIYFSFSPALEYLLLETFSQNKLPFGIHMLFSNSKCQLQIGEDFDLFRKEDTKIIKYLNVCHLVYTVTLFIATLLFLYAYK